MIKKNRYSQSKICYIKRGEQVPESWVLEKDESFKKGFIWSASSQERERFLLSESKGLLRLMHYVDYVLRPLFTKRLPRLYGKDINKVFFHNEWRTY